jgi:hypothetical protein
MKMTDEQQAELGRLTTGPVLRTWRGARARLALLQWDQLLLLMQHFECDLGDLDRRLWRRRGKGKTSERETIADRGECAGGGGAGIDGERRLWRE